MLTKKFDCIIVANGDFPHNQFVLDKIGQTPYVIACDGALQTLLQHNIMPDLIIGDLDSISPELKEKFHERIYHNPDQETNDLTKAASFAKKKHFKSVLIVAATGLREDHTLGNISLLTLYQNWFDYVCILSDYGYFIPIKKSSTFNCFPGQQISIFSLYPYASITSSGLRYPINERTLPIWWEGTLNEALNDTFTLLLKGEGNVLVYFRL